MKLMEKSIRGEPQVATRLHPLFPNGWRQLHSPNTDLAHAEKENGNMVRGLGVVVGEVVLLGRRTDGGGGRWMLRAVLKGGSDGLDRW